MPYRPCHTDGPLVVPSFRRLTLSNQGRVMIYGFQVTAGSYKSPRRRKVAQVSFTPAARRPCLIKTGPSPPLSRG